MHRPFQIFKVEFTNKNDSFFAFGVPTRDTNLAVTTIIDHYFEFGFYVSKIFAYREGFQQIWGEDYV